jgi:tRNA wybutosine-synthesizing protein 3
MIDGMKPEQEFLQRKKQAMAKLEKAKNEKNVDEHILPLLHIINSSEHYYTTSSCAGRIVLLELPELGDKQHATFLGKWHQTVKVQDISTAGKRATKGYLWLLAQSPILHVAAFTLSQADTLLKHAIAAGFKHSGLKSIGNNVIVELCSTERLDAPLGADGRLLCDNDYLDLLVSIANQVIERSTKKLEHLYSELAVFLRPREG